MPPDRMPRLTHMRQRRDNRTAKHREILKKVTAVRQTLYTVRRPIKQLPRRSNVEHPHDPCELRRSDHS